MSITEDFAAVAQELDEAKMRVSVAGGVLAASLALADVLQCHEARVWRIVAMRRLAKLSRANSASILSIADQLNSELREINEKRQ